jgi:hypothetical protein
MAIAFSAIVPAEKRAPANPVAVKGNTLYTRAFRVVIPASTTAASLVIGKLASGTLVHDVVFDTDTSLGASTLALSTTDSALVAATTLTVTGGKQMTRAAGLGVAVKSSSADLDLTLALATASSPASEVTLDVTLVCSGIGPVEDTYTTQST